MRQRHRSVRSPRRRGRMVQEAPIFLPGLRGRRGSGRETVVQPRCIEEATSPKRISQDPWRVIRHRAARVTINRRPRWESRRAAFTQAPARLGRRVLRCGRLFQHHPKHRRQRIDNANRLRAARPVSEHRGTRQGVRPLRDTGFRSLPQEAALLLQGTRTRASSGASRDAVDLARNRQEATSARAPSLDQHMP